MMTIDNNITIEAIKKSDLRKATKDSYIADINTIKKYCKVTDILEVIYNPEKYFPIIKESAILKRKNKEKTGISTVRTLVKTILAVLKHSKIKENNKELFCKWYCIFLGISKDLDKILDNNMQTCSSMNWADITSHCNKLEFGSLEHVVLSLYTLIPPRRQLDYWKILIVDDDDGIHHDIHDIHHDIHHDITGKVNLKTNILTIYHFKTNAKYNTWIKELPQELIDTIKTFLKGRDVESDYLFCKQDGQSYNTVKSFSHANNKIIKKVLDNKNASVNTIRHSAATFISTHPNLTRQEKKQYAYDMGHSFGMQQMYVEALPPPIKTSS